MKLHELKPAPGSRKRRMRVGRGIAAGKGKTAGRGTKGQKSRSGGKIPPWFEGGQTPVHVRVPKLRGFKRRDRIEYQVVNVGRIAEYASAGRFGADAGGKDPLTVNAEVLSNAGLISHAERPLKVLGDGDIDVKIFAAADAFTAAARSKIEAAGGFVQLLAPEPAAEPQAVAELDVAADSGTNAEAAVVDTEPTAVSADDDAPEAELEAEADAGDETSDSEKDPE